MSDTRSNPEGRESVGPESSPIGSTDRRRGGTLARTIAAALIDDLVNGRLQSGEPLLQADVSRRFGCSHIPVREALRQLAGEGLVELKSNAGARVATLDAASLSEIYQIRERLEPLALNLSAPLLSAGNLEMLEGYVSAMEDSTRTLSVNGLRTFMKLDYDFHLATIAAAPSPRLLQLIQTLLRSAQPYRISLVMHATDLASQYADHRLLLEALRQGDGISAGLVSQVHIRRTKLTFWEHPEYLTHPFAPSGLPGHGPGARAQATIT